MNLDIEICFRMEPAWTPETSISSILTEINMAAEKAWKEIGYVLPRGFVCEIPLLSYKMLRRRTFDYPLVLRHYGKPFSYENYILSNCLPVHIPSEFRFSITASSF